MTITRLPRRRVGALEVGAQGLGCLGMSDAYGPADPAEAVRTIHRALDLGVTLIDTADVYGFGAGEELLGKAVADRRDRAVLSTKFGVQRPGPGVGVGVRGDAAYVRQSCVDSLRRLGVDHLDLFFLTRVDTSVEIEETVGALAELVCEGLVREIGLSEAAPATIRRAHAAHPIAALQTEWSLWSRDIEVEIAPLARSLGITVVPYAPLGRGFLSGAIRTLESLADNDFRRLAQPRFQDGNREANLVLVDRFADLATQAGATPAQWALAWLHHQGPNVVPIPGARTQAHLEENADAAFLTLTPADLAAIDAIWPRGAAAGERWNEHSMSFVNR
ncbi:aldo/keto reductase [Actinokineospora auranticolor]|uniref:Aryl-alcohol dehydrogenase-like predicted oxidoreductase n=1 Tax=Actinokineospora auranticolor TaxID=155976 RepID=A0A2S6H1W3_9PSEU|nr:aldo/keto reductase [Actinokineospora auranticolor]PPK71421.1 aryl-alcohol dehydrogenase-like predicted oxidoreductase [Actinokineospora auranticolor]